MTLFYLLFPLSSVLVYHGYVNASVGTWWAETWLIIFYIFQNCNMQLIWRRSFFFRYILRVFSLAERQSAENITVEMIF